MTRPILHATDTAADLAPDTADTTPAPILTPLPDPGAAELLNPFATTSANPVTASLPGASADWEIFPDQPADIPNPNLVTPRDATAERHAWVELLALIQAHKDADTTVDAVDADSFLTNFS